MRRLIFLFSFFYLATTVAGIDFIEIPVKYISRSGDKAVVELHGKRLTINTKQIQNFSKQITGTIVRAKLSSEEIGIPDGDR